MCPQQTPNFLGLAGTAIQALHLNFDLCLDYVITIKAWRD